MEVSSIVINKTKRVGEGEGKAHSILGKSVISLPRGAGK